MSSEKDYKQMFDQMLDYQKSLHKQNQRRIKVGLRCIYIVPAIFLCLLFLTGSSKVIFLVLWIASLFAIAIYLIAVEYLDYMLQEKINEIEGATDRTPESLMEPRKMKEMPKVDLRKVEFSKAELPEYTAHRKDAKAAEDQRETKGGEKI